MTNQTELLPDEIWAGRPWHESGQDHVLAYDLATSAASTQPPGLEKVREALDNAISLFEAIVRGSQNQNINHVDFRVQVAEWAQDFLDSDAKALALLNGAANK